MKVFSLRSEKETPLETFFFSYLQIRSSCSRAAVTEYHSLGALSSRHLFLHSSGGWKSEIRSSAGLAPSEAPLLAGRRRTSPPSRCVCLCPDALEGCQWHWIRAHPDDLSFNLTTSLKTQSPNRVDPLNCTGPLIGAEFLQFCPCFFPE